MRSSHYYNFLTAALVSASLLTTTDTAARTSYVMPVGSQTISGTQQLEGPRKHTGISDFRRLGEKSPLVPPFCETFDNFSPTQDIHDEFARLFQIIDNNNDTRKWGLYNYVGDRIYGRCAYMLYPFEGAADDYLIPRAVKLEKGKYYLVSVYAGTYTDSEKELGQTFEIKMGRYNDVDGLNQVVIPTTRVNSSRLERFTGWFTPRYDGLYYIGVHGNSPAYPDYYNYLFVDNIAVEAARSGKEPSTITGLTMANDPDGSNKVTFTFTAPSVDIAGDKLTELTEIAVSRDGEELTTITAGLAPGKEISFSDTPRKEGIYEYTITPKNSAGTGEPLTVNRYAGIDRPVAPRFTEAREAEGNKVYLKWEAPATDINGMPINPSKLTYNLFDITHGFEDPKIEYEAATEGTFDATMKGQQQVFCVYNVNAVLNTRESAFTTSPMINVGTPFELPYHHTFTMDDYDRYPMLTDNNREVLWIFIEDSDSDVKSQDGDHGYLAMMCNTPDMVSTMMTGKIALGEAERPQLSLWTYVYPSDENKLELGAIDVADGSETTLRQLQLDELGTGWQRILVDLDALKGKTIQLTAKVTVVSHGYTLFDNMVVSDQPPVDLSIASVKCPEAATAGESFDIEVTVVNNGYSASDKFRATLGHDSEEIDAIEGTSIEPGESATLKLTGRMAVHADDTELFTIDIVNDNDGLAEDNHSEIAVARLASTLPPPSGLTATENNDGSVELSWTAPDMSLVAAAPVTDSFETYTDFSSEPGQWKTIDGDKGLVGGFSNAEMPVDLTEQSWWILPTDIYRFIDPFDGDKVMAQMYNVTVDGQRGVVNDDWLITPELYGGPQTIGFHAKAVLDDVIEVFEIWISKTGTDRKDFSLFAGPIEHYADWTPFFFTVPEGTRYAAVRCTSDYAFMLLLDNFIYTPAGDALGLPALTGYNVYVNGSLAATTTSTSATTHRFLPTDNYKVTAVYDNGRESHYALATLSTEDSIDGPAVADTTDSPAYYNLQGRRIASPEHGEVYIVVRGGHASKILY